ncbi:putative S-adenosyl-L-methionine-dependent methyltransferase [Plasmopara halstedii]
MVQVMVSLLLLLVTVHHVSTHLMPATDDQYDVLSRIDVDDSVVAVVRRNKILHLLYDETIIGAEFDDPMLRKQTTYPGFTIMQCSAYLDRKPSRALQIGLGIGSVPSFLRDMDIPTDVVEISEAVVIQAADYFQYEWCVLSDDEEDEKCPNGQTFVMDGLEFLNRKPKDLEIQTQEDTNPYDLFIVDVYTGWNPFAFLVREKILLIRKNWLTIDGVLVMNFVGFMHGPRAAAPKSIYRTLQSAFKHVKCFREMEDPNDPEAGNIVFYASDKHIDFALPSTGIYKDPPPNTFYSVVTNFPNWQIFTDLDSEVEVAIHQEVDDDKVRFVPNNDSYKTDEGPALRVLTEASHGQKDFHDIHVETQNHMRERVLSQFPLALWNELKRKSTT